MLRNVPIVAAIVALLRYGQFFSEMQTTTSMASIFGTVFLPLSLKDLIWSWSLPPSEPSREPRLNPRPPPWSLPWLLPWPNAGHDYDHAKIDPAKTGQRCHQKHLRTPFLRSRDIVDGFLKQPRGYSLYLNLKVLQNQPQRSNRSLRTGSILEALKSGENHLQSNWSKWDAVQVVRELIRSLGVHGLARLWTQLVGVVVEGKAGFVAAFEIRMIERSPLGFWSMSKEQPCSTASFGVESFLRVIAFNFTSMLLFSKPLKNKAVIS